MTTFTSRVRGLPSCHHLHSGNVQKKGSEVLHMGGTCRRARCATFQGFDRKKLKSTTMEGMDVDDENVKKKLEKLKIEFEQFTELMKEVLGDKVMVNDRSVDSLCVLTESEDG